MTKPRSYVPSAYGSGLLALFAVLVSLAAVNYLAASLRWRRDLTAERLYTLSEGTRNILANLERPVTLTFYFSKSLPEAPTPIKTYAQRVEDLLHEYQLAGGRNLVVERIDPRPDTEAEEWAIRRGIQGHPIDQFGSRLFMGLAAESGEARAAIPLLDPHAEQTLEYDITRMIIRVSRPAKPAIGVLSRLPVLGHGVAFRMPGMPEPDTTPAWVAFQELQHDFEVRELTPPLDAIAADIRALLIVQPPELDSASLLAIDQYLLGGGGVIAFLDPLCLAELQTHAATPAPFGDEPRTDSSLEPLTTAWGVQWNHAGIVVDIEAATPVHGQNRQIDENPLLLSLHPAAFNHDDIVTAGLERMLLPLSGHFAVTPVDGLNYQPIIQSSANAMVIDSISARFGVPSLLQRFRSENQPFTLALRIHGRFATAFPDGIEPTADADEAAGDAGADGGQTIPQPPRLPALRESRQPGVVLLVGDVDMLNDAYTVRQLSFFLGAQAMQPINDNIGFLMNAVEQTSGGIDLLSIRQRGRSLRPFTRVLELERLARLRWVDEEQRLQQHLEATRQRLSVLRAESDESQGVILSEDQRREIERFQDEQAHTVAALRNVRKNLREDIERLGLRLKLANILLVPTLICLGGILFALMRRMRIRRATA